MRFNGHNVLAIVVAALVIYAIEFVLFGLMIPADQYMAMTGMSADQAQDGASRMPFGILPPVLAAIGLSLAVKWRNAAGWLAGAMTGVLMAIFFGFAVSLYGYVYGPSTEQFVLIDLGHYVVCYAAAGAILAIWR